MGDNTDPFNESYLRKYMPTISEDDFLKKLNFVNKNFSALNLDKACLEKKVFENCTFKACSFNEAELNVCKFISCEFVSCNLSSIQIRGTSFSETVFEESKLIGINWTQAKWPYIKLNSPIEFYRSNISHSSFYELDLKEIIIDECKAHDVDFREGNFSNGCFVSTDFQGSMFMHTNLRASNFLAAMNYTIDPNQNDISKGKFSMPEAMNLLNAFQIEIE